MLVCNLKDWSKSSKFHNVTKYSTLYLIELFSICRNAFSFHFIVLIIGPEWSVLKIKNRKPLNPNSSCYPQPSLYPTASIFFPLLITWIWNVSLICVCVTQMMIKTVKVTNIKYFFLFKCFFVQTFDIIGSMFDKLTFNILDKNVELSFLS